MKLAILPVLFFSLFTWLQMPWLNYLDSSPLAAEVIMSSTAPEQATGRATAQPPNFLPVEGPTLKARLEAALKQGRSRSPQMRFWTAYTFDVRPGIAIDAQFTNTRGQMNYISDTGVFIGTSHGQRVETRNLGLFLLHEPIGQASHRAEIYNLERSREYSSYPVYWLGRAGNEESLNFLKELIAPAADSRLAEIATTAIGVHDDQRVAPLLKDLVRQSSQEKVRTTAVFWLGQLGGEQAFLTQLVRNDREPQELRKQAIFAIGLSKDGDALTTLQQLYAAGLERELKKQIAFALSQNDNKEAATDLLTKIATGDTDAEVRKQAIFWLGQTNAEAAVDELLKIYQGERDVEVKKQVLFAFSQHSSPRARAHLVEAARTGPEVEVRKQAIFWLGQKGDEASVDELFKLYDADQSSELRKQILFALSQMKNERAQERLRDVAARADSPEVRKEAIFWLGQRRGEPAVTYLSQLYDTEPNRAVKEHIIFSLSQAGSSGVRKLVAIAKGDTAVELRKKALFWLGQSRDPEALQFLQEILK